MKFLTTLGAVAALFFVSVAEDAQASRIDFHSTTTYGFTSNGEGSGRGLLFQADEDFSVTGIGLFFNLRALNFTVSVYDSADGTSLGSLINSASDDVGGSGAQDYTIGISQTFLAGNYYGIVWNPTDVVDWASTTPENSYYRDSDLPFDVGPATLLDGFEGRAGGSINYGNTLHAAFHMDIGTTVAPVPLPAGLPLMAAGLIAFGTFARRKG
jgi:hypothetical protein